MKIIKTLRKRFFPTIPKMKKIQVPIKPAAKVDATPVAPPVAAIQTPLVTEVKEKLEYIPIPTPKEVLDINNPKRQALKAQLAAAKAQLASYNVPGASKTKDKDKDDLEPWELEVVPLKDDCTYYMKVAPHENHGQVKEFNYYVSRQKCGLVHAYADWCQSHITSMNPISRDEYLKLVSQRLPFIKFNQAIKGCGTKANFSTKNAYPITAKTKLI